MIVLFHARYIGLSWYRALDLPKYFNYTTVFSTDRWIVKAYKKGSAEKCHNHRPCNSASTGCHHPQGLPISSVTPTFRTTCNSFPFSSFFFSMFRSIITTSRPLARQPLRQFTTTAIKMGVTVEVCIFGFLLRWLLGSPVHLSFSAWQCWRIFLPLTEHFRRWRQNLPPSWRLCHHSLWVEPNSPSVHLGTRLQYWHDGEPLLY